MYVMKYNSLYKTIQNDILKLRSIKMSIKKMETSIGNIYFTKTQYTNYAPLISSSFSKIY